MGCLTCPHNYKLLCDSDNPYNSLLVACQNMPITVNLHENHTEFMNRIWCYPFADWLKRNDMNSMFRGMMAGPHGIILSEFIKLLRNIRTNTDCANTKDEHLHWLSRITKNFRIGEMNLSLGILKIWRSQIDPSSHEYDLQTRYLRRQNVSLSYTWP